MQNEKRSIMMLLLRWWSIGDSNPWPFDCQSNALPAAPMPRIVKMVPLVGLEPTRISPHDFESCASANFATAANCKKSISNMQVFFK